MNKISHPIEPEELMAYLDGELTADRAAATAAHLGECAGCQSTVAGFRGVSQILKTWKAELAESDMPQAIASGLAESRPEPRSVFPAWRSWRKSWIPRWPTAAWVGAVAAIFLVVLGTLRFQTGLTGDVFSPHGRPTDYAVVNQPSDAQLETRLLTPAPPSSSPAAAPAQAGKFDRLERFAQLQSPPQVKFKQDQPSVERTLVANGPMIIRSAQLSLITKEFDKTRANLEAILKRHRGYVGELKAGGSTGSGRTLTATLRVPADQLDATLTEVKTLGRVESESQSGQDVTSQYVDLQARLSNARNTEQRLTDLLRNRTGKLSDVLEVEQELDRVRGEIEQMEAERKTMSNQVSYATLTATLAEDYKAQLQVVPPSTSTRLSNAAVEGYRSMADGVVSLALFLLSTGPSLLLWGVVLFLPARLIWKKVRRSFAS